MKIKKSNAIKLLFLLLICSYAFSLFVLIEREDTYLISKGLFALCAICSLFFMIKKGTFLLMNAQISMILFLILCFMSILWSDLPESSIIMCETLVQVIAMFLLFSNFFYYIGDEDDYCNVLLFAGIIMSIFFIGYYGIETYLAVIRSSGRLGTEFENTNTIGGTASFITMLCVYKALYCKKRTYYFVAFLPLIVLLGAGSKTAILIVISGCVFLFWYKLYIDDRKSRASKVLTVIFVIIGLVAVVPNVISLSIFNSSLARFTEMSDALFAKNTTSISTISRMKLIEIGWSQFLSSPVLGHGINAAAKAIYREGLHYSVLHSNFLELLADVGIVGLFLYYYAYYWCIKILKLYCNSVKTKAFVYAMLLMMLLLDVTGSTYNMQRNYLFLSMIVGISMKYGRGMSENE